MLAAKSSASKPTARGPFMPIPTSMAASSHPTSAGPGTSGVLTCAGASNSIRAVRGANTDAPPVIPASLAVLPLLASLTSVPAQAILSAKGKPTTSRPSHRMAMPRSSI
jgi:hypothetical protein